MEPSRDLALSRPLEHTGDVVLTDVLSTTALHCVVTVSPQQEEGVHSQKHRSADGHHIQGVDLHRLLPVLVVICSRDNVSESTEARKES